MPVGELQQELSLAVPALDSPLTDDLSTAWAFLLVVLVQCRALLALGYLDRKLLAAIPAPIENRSPSRLVASLFGQRRKVDGRVRGS
jgi:hypothetical protein